MRGARSPWPGDDDTNVFAIKAPHLQLTAAVDKTRIAAISRHAVSLLGNARNKRFIEPQAL